MSFHHQTAVGVQHSLNMGYQPVSVQIKKNDMNTNSDKLNEYAYIDQVMILYYGEMLPFHEPNQEKCLMIHKVHNECIQRDIHCHLLVP